MHSFIDEVCSQSKALINMIDATMVEVVLYCRGETMIYANDEEFQKQLSVQADALCDSIAQLDGLLENNREFLDAAKPPENMPGQVLAIAEVIVKQIERFDPGKAVRPDQLFLTLPVFSRHDLMERLGAYYHYLVGATGNANAKVKDPDFDTDPPAPYWW